MKAIHAYIMMLSMALLLTACDVHEFPEHEEPGPLAVDVPLEIDFVDGEMKEYRTINTFKPTRGLMEMNHDLRITIEVTDDSETLTRSDAPILRETYTLNGYGERNHSTSIRLSPGNYRILAICDYVAAGTTSSLYYDLEDFFNINLLSVGDKADGYVHSGTNKYREIFRGEARVRVGDDGKVYNPDDDGVAYEIKVPMHRPIAKFQFVSDDFQEFVTKVVKERSEHKEPGTRVYPPEQSDYSVRFRYTGYMPSTYNAYIDKPVDSRTGVAFISPLSSLQDGRTQMGFDYVFVNGVETSVNIVVDVMDAKTGNNIATSDVVEVPLKRNKVTVVTGKFFTTSASGGLGVDASFYDEYDIEIK